jgi:hypothetical protein
VIEHDLADATGTLTPNDRAVLVELLAGHARRFTRTAPDLAGWYAAAAELVRDARADQPDSPLARALASDLAGPRLQLLGFDP